MDKIVVGLPRGLFYYHYGKLWTAFFEFLHIKTILSEPTNRAILELGNKYANDEMCLSMKLYLGHVASLLSKSTMILVPRIDNYGQSNQTCTNFLAAYDIVKSLFDIPLLHYNVCETHLEKEEKGFIQMGRSLGFSIAESKSAYQYAKEKEWKEQNRLITYNYNCLSSNRCHVLVIAHPYVIYDALFGKQVLQYLKKLNVEIIMSDLFDSQLTNKRANELSHNLYWKYSKELIGAIQLVKYKIDGILFVTTFPCGPDSLVNELIMRKVGKPHLNLVLDDMDSFTGMETRLESFIDILEEKRHEKCNY